MDTLLLNLMFFFRPIISMYVDIKIFGLGFADLLTIFFTLFLVVLGINNSASKSKVPVSVTENWIMLFILWVTIVSLYNYDVVNFKAYIKIVLPLITFLVMKRAIQNKDQYVKLLVIMVAGFSIPVVVSMLKTVSGSGLYKEIYWTGLQRYQGAYANVHDVAHNMALLIMILVILYFITDGKIFRRGKNLSLLKLSVVTILVIMALYNMYSAQVRTVYIGIILFGMVILFLRSKKGLVVYILGGIVVVIVFSSTIYTIFFDVIEAIEGKQGAASAGSGRFEIWAHNWGVYSKSSLPNQILGLGIGNKAGTTVVVGSGQDLIFDSHNDWLQIFMSTGPLGLVLMMGVYFSLYTKIRQLSGGEKAVYFAFFITVVVMNMASNSYINRFPLAQTFFMLMVYLELSQTSKGVPKVVKINKDNIDDRRILFLKKK